MSTSERREQWPSIAPFYSHRDVFLTGATGFMGKCLLEKVLRSLPDVSRVLVLVRPKRGKSMKERVDSLLASKVREKLLLSDKLVASIVIMYAVCLL